MYFKNLTKKIVLDMIINVEKLDVIVFLNIISNLTKIVLDMIINKYKCDVIIVNIDTHY